jgi:glycosyltransferase involved in cell wall biosynthesis
MDRFDHQARSKRVRIIPELRNYHVASLASAVPADTFYFNKKYDLDDRVLPSTLQEVGFLQFLRILRDPKYGDLEIWEPLWVRLLPKHILAVATWKSRNNRFVYSYAMENNDIASLIGGKRSVPAWVTKFLSLPIGIYIAVAYTKIAYASSGSRDVYWGLPLVTRVTSTIIPNLPKRPEVREIVPVAARQFRAILLCSMEARKGVREVLRAWPKVEEAIEGASLVLIGNGPLAQEARSWALENPSSRIFLGAMSHEDALTEVAKSKVLLLPSVRWGRWREQIGLPIHEALINGLTVVSTDETGLAEWLKNNGHVVVPRERLDQHLANAIVGALLDPLPREQVLESLPTKEARMEANHWLQHDSSNS